MKSMALIWNRVSTLLPAMLWLVWIAVFSWLLYGGRYRAFLQPKFWPLLALALVVLALFLLSFIQNYPPPAVGRAKLSRWMRCAILILPAVFLYNTYGQSLGASALSSRTAGTGPVMALEDFGNLGSIPKYEPGKIILLSTLTMHPDEFAGKSIMVEGSVYRDRNVPDQYFLMYRFFIFCCAADAIPVWVLVQSEQSSRYETDTWVKITGTFSLQTINNQKVPMVLADTIEKIPAPPPEQRYLFF